MERDSHYDVISGHLSLRALLSAAHSTAESMRSPSPLSPMEGVVTAAGRVILGKDRQVRLALACLLARGHLLIEDLPGVGKTTLAHVLAQLLGLHFQRIQFTSDMLPADILGVSVFDRETGAFNFHAGPVFAQLVLADEINRATPKTQSALLEAMEERQVTTEGQTRPLPTPFFVIATQNPAYQIGTFPLPESQLDRFLMRIELGYPDRAAERELLSGADRRELLAGLSACVGPAELLSHQAAVRRVHVAEPLIDYVQALANHSRVSADWQVGLSPRAALALLASARAWAWLAGRDHVLPEDVQAVLPSVAGHRLRPAGNVTSNATAGTLERLIDTVPLP
jgi:MoxR-like ATPase